MGIDTEKVSNLMDICHNSSPEIQIAEKKDFYGNGW